MSINDSYIGLSNTDMQLGGSLSAKINTEINNAFTNGMPALTLSNHLRLTDSQATGAALLRYSADTLQYSLNGGITWINISNAFDYEWASDKIYVQNDVVHYGNGWYVCVVNSTLNALPNTSTDWQLITLGTKIIYVDTVEKFEAALENSTNCIIYINGNISGAIYAQITASSIVIYSNETTTITSSNITFNMAPSANVYWHCIGTTITGSNNSTAVITVPSGTLWIDRIKAPAGITLDSHTKYRKIDGDCVGGEQAWWTQSDVLNTDIKLIGSASCTVEVGKAYKWVLSSTVNGILSIAGIVPGRESFVSLYIDINDTSTVTGDNVIFVDALQANSVNYCWIHYDGAVARLYVYAVYPHTT